MLSLNLKGSTNFTVIVLKALDSSSGLISCAASEVNIIRSQTISYAKRPGCFLQLFLCKLHNEMVLTCSLYTVFKCVIGTFKR